MEQLAWGTSMSCSYGRGYTHVKFRKHLMVTVGHRSLCNMHEFLNWNTLILHLPLGVNCSLGTSTLTDPMSLHSNSLLTLLTIAIFYVFKQYLGTVTHRADGAQASKNIGRSGQHCHTQEAKTTGSRWIFHPLIWYDLPICLEKKVSTLILSYGGELSHLDCAIGMHCTVLEVICKRIWIQIVCCIWKQHIQLCMQ